MTATVVMTSAALFKKKSTAGNIVAVVHLRSSQQICKGNEHVVSSQESEIGQVVSRIREDAKGARNDGGWG